MSRHAVYWALCMISLMFVHPAVSQEPSYGFDEVFNEDDLLFTRPVDIEFYNDNTEALVVEKVGRVYHLDNNPNSKGKDLVLDISEKTKDSNEEGMLGIALDPSFSQNGYYYIQYSEIHPEYTSMTKISRFTFNFNEGRTDPATEVPLIGEPQFARSHKGGTMTFDNNGLLFFGFGDGADDSWEAQNRTNLKGSIMRIDVSTIDTQGNYTIPEDNPYFNNSEGFREEIYAYGLRNPWRFSIDTKTNFIWAGDVGEAKYEEIDLIEAGNNYGWPYMEGDHCFNSTTSLEDSCGANSTLTMPIFSYSHVPSGDDAVIFGAAVIGGYVYRGTNYPDLVGKYIFSDFLGGVWTLTKGDAGYQADRIVPDGSGINSFAVDDNGEIIVLTRSYRSNIFYLVPSSEVPSGFDTSYLLSILVVVFMVFSWAYYYRFSRKQWKTEKDDEDLDAEEASTLQDSGPPQWYRSPSLALVVLAGFLIRLINFPGENFLAGVADQPFSTGDTGSLAPLSELYYRVVASLFQVSPLLSRTILSLLGTGLLIHMMYISDKFLRRRGWTDSHRFLFHQLFSTFYVLDSTLLKITKRGHVSILLLWLVVLNFYYLSNLRADSGRVSTLLYGLTASLMVCTSYLTAIGIIAPSIIYMREEFITQKRARLLTLTTAFLGGLIVTMLIAFQFSSYDVKTSLLVNLLPRGGEALLYDNAFFYAVSSFILFIPYLLSLRYTTSDTLRLNLYFLVSTMLVTFLSGEYVSQILPVIFLVIAISFIKTLVENTGDSPELGMVSLLLVFGVLLHGLGYGISLSEIQLLKVGVRIVIFVLTAILLKLSFDKVVVAQLSSKGISLTFLKVVGILMVIFLATAQVSPFVTTPNAVGDEGLSDIAGHIMDHYPGETLFVPDNKIKLEMDVLLLTAHQVVVASDGTLVNHFIDEREQTALIIVKFNYLMLTADGLMPTDYYKNYPEIVEVSQSGDYGLFLIDNTVPNE